MTTTTANPTNPLSPTEALRTIRAIVEDKSLTVGQRLAIVAIVLRADNATGIAWAGYRSMVEATGLAPATISGALQKAGKYLKDGKPGRNGAASYIVKALQWVKRASVSEAPLDPAGASVGEAQRFSDCSASASVTEHILTPVTNPLSNPSKKRAAKQRAADPAVKTFIDWFSDEYNGVVGTPYVVSHGKDELLVKKLLAAIGDNGVPAVEALKAAARAMLADKWVLENRAAGIGLLSKQINKWRAAPAEGTAATGNWDDLLDVPFRPFAATAAEEEKSYGTPQERFVKLHATYPAVWQRWMDEASGDEGRACELWAKAVKITKDESQ